MIEVAVRDSLWGETHYSQMPGNWNELNKKQLLAFIRIANDSKKEEDRKRMEIMYHLTGIAFPIFWRLEKAILDELWSKVKFLDADARLTKNIISGFWHKGIYYQGPGEGFHNVKVLETGWWDKFYMDYAKTKDPAALDLAIACLFRRISLTKSLNPFTIYDDYRVPFNKDTVERRAERFADLNINLKRAILQQYIGCRSMLEKQYPNVYNQENADTNEFGFLSLIIDLAGTKFGDVDAVQNKNWTLVLSHLEITEKRNLKNKPTNSDGNKTTVYK